MLDYQIDFNFLYFNTFGDQLPNKVLEANTDYKASKAYQTQGDESNIGTTGDAGQPAARAAGILQSQTDYAQVTLDILGDPDWIPPKHPMINFVNEVYKTRKSQCRYVVAVDVHAAQEHGCMFYQTESYAVLCSQEIPTQCLVWIKESRGGRTPIYIDKHTYNITHIKKVRYHKDPFHADYKDRDVYSYC